jgi:Type II secretion system (T2SS), protein M subtype b
MTTARILRRLIILTVPLCVLLGIASTVYFCALSYRARSEQILDHRRLLGRLEALVAQAGDIDRLSAAHRAGQSSKLLHDTPTLPQLIVQLQRQIQTAVIGHRAQLISASEIQPREEHGLTFVGLRLEISGSMESLASALKALEAAVPLLFIEKAVIAAHPMNQESASRMPLLSLSLEVLAASRLKPTTVDLVQAQ